MIKQLKELLSEVTIDIYQNVNSTHISFHFKDNEPKCKDNVGTEKLYIEDTGTKPGFVEKRQKLEAEAKAKAKEAIEKIVEASGIPKDKVIIATGIGNKTEQPDMFPDVPKRSKKMLERLKRLEELEFKEKDDQLVRGGIGLALTYVDKAEDAEFERAFKQFKDGIENSKAMAEAEKKKAKDSITDSIVHQVEATSFGKAKVTGELTLSDEQQEMIEEQYAVPANTQYKGKPATPDEAFEKPDVVIKEEAPEVKKKDLPPPPDAPELILKSENEEDKQMLWDTLMEKCKQYDISTEGINFEEQSVGDIKDLHNWVDETIEEESSKVENPKP